MKRMRVLFAQRRMMVLTTLAILVLAVAALVASSASFTASSTNVGNTFTAGDLTLTAKNSGGADGGFILTASNIKPGYDGTGYVAIQTIGVGGEVTLTSSETGSEPDLADVLHITMTEVANMSGDSLAGGVSPMDCQMNDMPATYTFADLWGSGTATRYFKINVTWPDTASDNDYKTTNTTAEFNWTVVSQ